MFSRAMFDLVQKSMVKIYMNFILFDKSKTITY